MPFTRLQPILYVFDFKAERDFYKKLGFTINYESETFVGLSSGNILFGIQEASQHQTSELNKFVNWQIGVNHIREIERICKKQNLQIIQQPELQEWGEWIMKVKSPNGVIVSFEGEE